MNTPITLTLFVVRFYIDTEWLNQRHQWKAVYFLRQQAEEFFETIPKGDFISLTEEPTNSPLYTESRGTPYRYLCGDTITLGDFHDSKGSYISTAYTSKALLDVAKAEYDRKIGLEHNAQDSYYARPWV